MTKPRTKAPEPARPVESYITLGQAYDHFNTHLFGGLLPQCLITLQRHQGAYGYFSPERMAALDADGQADAVDEIALNPANFEGRTAEEILSTLVHEMAHVWQHHYGTPPRRCYHDREWSAKMRAIGLVPSHNGQPGGKETGQHMSHYIDPDGPFVRAYRRLGSPVVLYRDLAGDGQTAAKKRASKTKYTCPGCGQNAWAKPDACLVCGHCQEEMTAEPPDAD